MKNKDMIRIGDIADVFRAQALPDRVCKAKGHYLVIEPRRIRDGIVDLWNAPRLYCDEEDIIAADGKKRDILKHGDVLISTVNGGAWAVYHGYEDQAVATEGVTVIRGRDGYETSLKIFLHTQAGADHLSSELKKIAGNGAATTFPLEVIEEISIPDPCAMEQIRRLNREMDLEASMVALFEGLGWDARTDHKTGNFHFDLALFDNGELKGVVEGKAYEVSEVQGNQKLAGQLQWIKDRVGEAVAVYLFVGDAAFEYTHGGLTRLSELPRPENTRSAGEKPAFEVPASAPPEALNVEKDESNPLSLIDKLLVEMALQHKEVMGSLGRIEEKVDDISQTLQKLCQQINGFQSLVQRQLELACTPEEEERIIHAFSEECVSRITDELSAKSTAREYDTEVKKLEVSFGKGAWGKLSKESKDFLVSSKISYNHLIGMPGTVDYSGVCVLVTKALEVEMHKRFCVHFLDWLGQKYKSNYSMFPTALLDDSGSGPIRPESFTLGSVAHVLCRFYRRNLSAAQKQNNRDQLAAYARAQLFSGMKNDQDILDLLKDYADKVEDVRKGYRNPSAHTDPMARTDAEQCFALVVDTQKLLKKMLDSFDA